MKPGDVPVQVYKPLRDKYLDELFKRIRSRFGGIIFRNILQPVKLLSSNMMEKRW